MVVQGRQFQRAMLSHRRIPAVRCRVLVRAIVIVLTAAALTASVLSVSSAGADDARADDAGANDHWAHGIAMHGQPLYGPEFTHLAYANPNAPVGGSLRQAVVGSFDSLNPFIVIGRTAAGVRSYHFASLMARSWDEPFSLYGYVAASMETPDDRSWVAFRIDPQARFHDGSPVTVDDVVFSMEALRRYGLPGFRRNYQRIAEVERLPDNGVRFWFTDDADRETPLVIALMPILSRAYYEANPLNEPSLNIPLGSGPYRIAEVEPGRRIAYERVADWWAADRPMFRGMFNFDRLIFDYYRDDGVAFEAFQTGEQNFRRETSAERWASQYGFQAAADGRVSLEEFPHWRPDGMLAFAFNTRRPLFDDPRVREALSYAFDFEWVNTHLLQGQYDRTDSYFVNSELAASGTAAGAAELAVLAPFADRVPPEVLTEVFAPPATDGRGGVRQNLRRARDLLAEAGWVVDGGRLVRADGSSVFAFEILLRDADYERIALAFADNLRRLGIEASVRTVDTAQYTARTESFDFDMILHHWRVTLSPGAEQNLYWGSRSAEIEGTRNYPGVRDPVVDALIQRIENAPTREDLVTTVRALDRVLLWGHYVVPLYHQKVDRVAFWDDLRWVRDARPLYGPVVDAWWLEE